MQSKNDLESAAELLWKSNTEKEWERFSGMLKNSKARYYKVVFKKGKVATTEDLRDSYANLYTAQYKQISKVPIFKTKGKEIEGAMMYLKGLLNTNK